MLRQLTEERYGGIKLTDGGSNNMYTLDRNLEAWNKCGIVHVIFGVLLNASNLT